MTLSVRSGAGAKQMQGWWLFRVESGGCEERLEDCIRVCMFLPTLRRFSAAIMSAYSTSAPFSKAVVKAMQKL